MVALKSFTCLTQRNVQALHNWYKTTHLTNKTLWWIDHKPCVCPVRRHHLKEIRLLPQGWSKNSYFYSLGGLFLWDSWRLFSSSSLQHKVVVLSNDQSLNGPQSLPTPPGLSCQYYMQESGEAVVTVTRTHAKPTRFYSIWLKHSADSVLPPEETKLTNLDSTFCHCRDEEHFAAISLLLPDCNRNSMATVSRIESRLEITLQVS